MEKQVIEINPQRTEHSPITDIFTCRITLYENFIESEVHYTYTEPYMDEMGVPRVDTGIRKFHVTMYKGLVEIDRTTDYRIDDNELERGISCIKIRSASGFFGTIDMSEEDAQKLYETLKAWRMS